MIRCPRSRLSSTSATVARAPRKSPVNTRGDLVPVVHRSRNPVRDGDELRERGIDHDGGHQSLDITQKALLGGVGSAHAR
jgi:hypothetical protein